MVKLFPWKTMNPIRRLLYDIRGNAFGRRCNWKKSSLIVMAGAKVPSMMPYRQLVLWYLLSRVVLRSLEKADATSNGRNEPASEKVVTSIVKHSFDAVTMCPRRG